MGVHYFTKEQIEELESNPYVAKVSEKAITYTQEFREEFHRQYLIDPSPVLILRNMGFDTKVLGSSRINGITKRVKAQANRDQGFKDTREDRSGRPSKKERSLEKRNAYLEQKLKFKDQQIEALKKTNLIKRKAALKLRNNNTHSSKT